MSLKIQESLSKEEAIEIATEVLKEIPDSMPATEILEQYKIE
ncbi:hypothetical protein [Chengkuizengella sediminis]|nr:hypothetical protein [Chengkuizengella sediminis]